MDLRTCQWHQPYLDLFKARRDSLPRIVSNAEVYGHVKEGPLAGVPIAGCLGDQQAAMLGGWPLAMCCLCCCCRARHMNKPCFVRQCAQNIMIAC